MDNPDAAAAALVTKVYEYYGKTTLEQKETIVELIDGSEYHDPPIFSLTAILRNDNDAKVLVREEILEKRTPLEQVIQKLGLTEEQKSEFLRELERYLIRILGIKNAPVDTPPIRPGEKNRKAKSRKSKSRKYRNSRKPRKSRKARK
jgi:hypothetical protein